MKLENRSPEEIRIPLFARRGERIDLAGKNAIILPNSLSPDSCCVLGSAAIIGAENEKDNPLREVWVEGFEIQRHPVTNEAYLEFLNYLVSAGAVDEAKEVAPRYRGVQGGMVYGFDGERFYLTPDEDGDVWEPDWPVILVSPSSAVAYARYWSALTGQAWRLPTPLEWEKAARGVDGRSYPWGDYFDPTWACVRGAREGRPLPASILDFPADSSPYGMRGAVGNAQDICLSPEDPDQAFIMGGAWSHRPEFVSLSKVVPVGLGARLETLGFRLCRTL